MIDPRYETVRGLLEAGAIKKFTDIFDWIPKTVVRQDINTNGKRINKLAENPSGFTLNEVYQISSLIGYDTKKLVNMALDEMHELEKNNRSILKNQGK